MQIKFENVRHLDIKLVTFSKYHSQNVGNLVEYNKLNMTPARTNKYTIIMTMSISFVITLTMSMYVPYQIH